MLGLLKLMQMVILFGEEQLGQVLPIFITMVVQFCKLMMEDMLFVVFMPILFILLVILMNIFLVGSRQMVTSYLLDITEPTSLLGVQSLKNFLTAT